MRELRLQQNGTRARYVAWPLSAETATEEANKEENSQHEKDNWGDNLEKKEEKLQGTNDTVTDEDEGDMECVQKR